MQYIYRSVVFFLFVFFVYEVNIFGYTFTVTNLTGKDLKVQIHLSAAFGKFLSKKIKAYDIENFPFTGWWGAYCLKKITVSTKKGNGWSKEKKAIIGVLESHNRFKELEEAGLIGRVAEEYAIWIGMSMCKSRDFVLIIDQESKKIYAVTELEI